MQTCETCGAQFEPSENVQEVTSLRILCQKCAAERAAAKARRAQPAATAPKAGAPSAARPVSPPATARPAPRSTNAAPRSERPERPAPEIPAQRVVERPARPVPLTTPAAAARPPHAAANNAAPARPAALRKKKKPEIELHSGDLKKRGSREMLIAYVAAVVVIVAAGGVLWKVLAKKGAEAKAFEEARARVTHFRDTFMAMNIDTEDGAKQLIVYVDENKPLWTAEDFASEVITRTAKAKNLLEREEKSRGLRQRLAEVEAVMAKASELPPNELAEARRKLGDLAAEPPTVGADFVAQVAKDIEECDRIYIERLTSAAQTAAATEPLDRAALTTIQQSEDELFKIFNATALAWNKNRQDPALTARKDELEVKYKELIKLSDDAVGRFFTPAVIEAVPWRDLLSEDQKGQWKGAATLKGYKNLGGEMHLVGLDPSEEGASMISIGDKEVWRDFLIDIEFTITKGSFELFFRMPIQFQEGILSADLTTDEGHLEAGRAYTYAYSCVGSSFVEEQKGEDSPGLTDSTISWVKVRKGAFAIAIPKETEVRITRLRAKVLR